MFAYLHIVLLGDTCRRQEVITNRQVREPSGYSTSQIG